MRIDTKLSACAANSAVVLDVIACQLYCASICFFCREATSGEYVDKSIVLLSDSAFIAVFISASIKRLVSKKRPFA